MIRKHLIKLAKDIESSWTHTPWKGANVQITAGWYVTEFTLAGVLTSTPKLIVKDSVGRNIERALVGAHSGRNRVLIYLPQGRLQGFTKAIEFQTLARVPTIEARARIVLICLRYLWDFFGPFVLMRLVLMQFKRSIDLSNDVLKFYSAREREHTILARFDYWRRRPRRAKIVAWWLRDIKIAVLIEEEAQRESLISSLIPPELIVLVSDDSVHDIPADFLMPLSATEQLRSASLLILKIEIAKRKRRASPVIKLVYSDHDFQLGAAEQPPPPVFKPNASLAYLYCFAYVGPTFAVARSSLGVLSQRELLNPEAQYALLLRLFEEPSACLHIADLLYHSNSSFIQKTPEPVSEESHWPDIAWVSGKHGNHLVASDRWVEEPSVDLLIPTRDGLEFLEPCVAGILEKTNYQNFQIKIVDNGSQQPETIEWLADISLHSKVQVIDFPSEFNFSAINNLAAASGKGEYLALINNDIEVIEGDWLRQMMVWAKQPNVGIVGAKLLYSNGLVQHAGVTIGMGNAAGHIHRLEPGDSSGYQNRCVATQNMMAVTAACLITPRSLYEQLGGLNEAKFKVAYNDIDYCLRVEEMGLDVIWTPEACLYHHESVSRGDDMSEEHIERYFGELSQLQKKWKTKGFVDKYYNKHLRIGDEGVYPRTQVAGEDELIVL